MPTYSVLAAFAMKVFILVIAVHCALFFRGAYLLDESFDEIQREEDKLPHYLKDDDIRRVAKLTKDHFNKTLKASRMLVVLFYSSEELSSRFQSVCNRIQDSIEVIESQMGNEEVFTFDINREIFTLESLDLNVVGNAVERYIIVLQEYKKMITSEKSRRKLADQIRKTNEVKTLKDNLKNNRQRRRLLTNPYQKNQTPASPMKRD